MFWKQLVKLQQVSVFCLKTICLSLALWAAMKPQRVKQSMFIATWRNDPVQVQAQGFEENGQSWISECLWAQNYTSKPTVSQARNCCAMFLLETNCSQLTFQDIWTTNFAVLRQAHLQRLKQEWAAMKAPQCQASSKNKWVLMWKDLVPTNWYAVFTKHWRRTSSNSRFPTAAENQTTYLMSWSLLGPKVRTRKA